MAEAPFDLGIRCDYLIPMKDGKAEVLRNQFIGIRGTKIAAISPWVDGKFSALKWVDGSRHIVIPGLINGHTHLAMSLMRGLADDQPFHEWLFDYILPTESKIVDADFVRVGTNLAALECIRFGVTTVGDMYFYLPTVGDSLDRAGLRAKISECITDFPSPDDKENNGARFKQIAAAREKFQNHSRIEVALGPHAPYTCGDETLKKVAQESQKTGCSVFIHVSETAQEVAEHLKKHGVTPAERLKRLGLMNDRTVYAHGVHLTDSEIADMAHAGTGVIHNPESNMKLSSGVAPLRKFLNAGVRLGIGTDGSASNNDLSILRELDSAAKLQKLSHAEGSLKSAEALRMATWGGAQALGMLDRVGSLEVGKEADLALVNHHYPHMQPIHDAVSQLIYSANGLEVDTTIVAGACLMENRLLKVLDPEKIYSESAAYQKKIRENLK